MLIQNSAIKKLTKTPYIIVVLGRSNAFGQRHNEINSCRACNLTLGLGYTNANFLDLHGRPYVCVIHSKTMTIYYCIRCTAHRYTMPYIQPTAHLSLEIGTTNNEKH